MRNAVGCFLFLAVVFAVLAAPCQQPVPQAAPRILAPPATPGGSIDAASIKPDNSGSHGSHTNSDKGRITFTNVSLRSLLQTAFDLQPYRLVGPSFMDDARFDAVVTFTGVPTGQRSVDTYHLLEPWLTAQFQIRSHHETRPLPGYLLLVAKGGAKMKPAPGCCSTDVNSDNGLVKFTADTNMAQFVNNLGRNLDRPVVIDETGLTGNFHIEFSFVPNTLTADGSAAGSVQPGPSIYDALEHTLGLKLQSATVPVDVLVIDAISRTPTGN